MLPIGILAYNISEHSITKRTLFFMNKEFEADVLIKTRKYKELVLYTVIKMKKIYEVQNELRYNLIFFNKKIKKFANKKKV